MVEQRETGEAEDETGIARDTSDDTRHTLVV
jgi:hypothetical protein